MNIIEELHQIVTPKVLGLVRDYVGDDGQKTRLLSSVYSILGARLSDPVASDRVESLIRQDANVAYDGQGLLDALIRDENGQSQVQFLTDELSKEYGLPSETTTAVMNNATPLVFEQFRGLAGGGSLSGYLQNKLADLAEFLPTWATALLPAGLLAGLGAWSTRATATPTAVVQEKPVVVETKEPVKTAPVATPVHNEPKKEGSFLKSLLPIIGLLILAGLIWLLLRSCQEKPAPVAKPAETTTAQNVATTAVAANLLPATFSLATDETGQAIYSCQSKAGGEGVFGTIRTALSGVFGVSDKCEFETSKDHADNLAVGEHLPAIFGLMKGVPNASLTVNDKNIRLNSTDPTALQKLIDGVKGVVGADYVVEAEPQLDTEAAVTTSLESAKTALDGLTETATAEDVVKALNMQIINFATASHAIPDANKAILDTAATKLTALPEARLKITGHTDNQGNHASNQKLSERRANAVREYLVSKGVPAEQLEIFGASFDEPVATNATEQGRFQNRRIEFTLVSKDGTVTAIGNADNSQAVANAESKGADVQTPETTDAKANTDVAPADAKQ